MSTEENKAKVRAFWEEAMNKGNLDAIDDLVAPDEVMHRYPDEPDVGRGPAVVKQAMTALRASWPDIQSVVELQVAEGDLVVTRWRARGTYCGGDPTMPDSAIGKPVTVTGVSINRFSNGKSVESWQEADRLGMLRQLELIPTSQQSTA